MTFLPNNYSVPVASSNYMRFQDGANTFRVLSSAIVGFEYWNNDNKPVRLMRYPNEQPKDMRLDADGHPTIKHFWAFAVWNYNEQKIQILELTQKTIMNAIKALVDNPKWGDPKNYDITVTRTGEKLTTEYNVQPNPHEQLSAEVAAKWISTPVDLNQLFTGGDPFAAKN